MPQFAATIKHFTEGLTSFTVSAAVKNIEGWETTLGEVEEAGAKAILKDLGNLKKHLQAGELDGPAIGKLVAKLGKETVALSHKGEGAKAKNIQSLGEALVHAAEQVTSGDASSKA